jgi:hypothetical protein
MSAKIQLFSSKKNRICKAKLLTAAIKKRQRQIPFSGSRFQRIVSSLFLTRICRSQRTAIHAQEKFRRYYSEQFVHSVRFSHIKSFYSN